MCNNRGRNPLCGISSSRGASVYSATDSFKNSAVVFDFYLHGVVGPVVACRRASGITAFAQVIVVAN